MTKQKNEPSSALDTTGKTRETKLQISQLKFSVEADGRLRTLQMNTGVTPNLLCRLGFCLSLAEAGYPKTDSSADSDRVIKYQTLVGEYAPVFVSLLRLRHPEQTDDVSALAALFGEHMHRGILLLANRVKTPGDILALVTSSKTR